jgi:O-antigen/teichoic acid export membrane protein
MTYRPIVVTEVSEALAYNLGAIAAVAAGAGVWGVAGATVFRAVVGAILITKLGPLGFVRPRLSWARVRPILTFGISVQAVQFVNVIRDQGVNIVTAAVAGFAVLGFWTMAWRLLQAIFLVFESLWKVSLPATSRMLDAGEAVKPIMERALLLSAVLTGIMVVPLAGSAHSLVPVIFGHKWQGTVAVLPWAALALMLTGPLSTVAVGYFYALGKPNVILRVITVHTLVWFAVFIPLLPALGAKAIGIGFFASALSDVLLLGLPLYWTSGVAVVKVTAVPVAAAIVASGAAATVSRSLGANVGGLIAALLCSEAVFVGIVRVAKRAALIDVMRLAGRGIAGMVGIRPPARSGTA